MNRKFSAIVGALSLAAVLACGIGVASRALAQTSGGAVSAPAVNVPKTWGKGGVLTPDTKHSCGGDDILYVFPGGGSACFQSPPSAATRTCGLPAWVKIHGPYIRTRVQPTCVFTVAARPRSSSGHSLRARLRL